MQVLEKINIGEKKLEINGLLKEKILEAKLNYQKTKKSYSIQDAYNIGLSKLNF